MSPLSALETPLCTAEAAERAYHLPRPYYRGEHRRREHQDTGISSTRNTLPHIWNGLLRVIGVALIVCLAACAVSDHSRSPLSHAETSGGTIRPALDRILSPGDIYVAEGHLRDFGYDPGPVDGLFTAQTQAAVRAFQARYGIRISGLLDRDTRQELLPGFDQNEFDP